MTYLHQLIHAAVTAVGTRPRPTAPHAEDLHAVPVRVALYHPGADRPFAVVACESFALHPHRPAGTDADGRPLPERQARCVLACVVPPAPAVAAEQLDAEIARLNAEAPEPDPPPFDGTTPMVRTVARHTERAAPNSGDPT